MKTNSIDMKSFEDGSELNEEFKKIHKEYHNSMIFLDDKIYEKKLQDSKDEESLPVSLKSAISKNRSKFIGFIEKYMTHKFYYNLVFVTKVALGKIIFF